MSTTAPAPPPPATRPDYAIGQEIRLAVVLYGGVSLAIYMNGIAQEMLRLVRATAGHPAANGGEEPRFADEELSDSEVVYRRLGEKLSRRQMHDGGDRRVIRTRFIVDTISGTSAGGINGIFLAKALANDQSIRDLEQLWIDEGDIGVLINDQVSVEGLDDLQLSPDGPLSLLNGDRMYLKLLKALQAMDTPPNGSAAGVPLVDALHLYVTTTDILGLTIPLRLEDKEVNERRHKHVFHFIHGRDATGNERADFTPDQSEFLAFAARCTSSFPFAFEPMRMTKPQELKSTVEAIENFRKGLGQPPREPACQKFFSQYARLGDHYELRSFGDGGYLDNKPFAYAIDALSLRADQLPAERRLIYVEPTPEHLQRDDPSRPVNVLDNVMAAMFTLPTYETIREDLQRVLARNRLIERIDRITEHLDSDVAIFGQGSMPMDEWRVTPLSELIKRFGVAYGGYHRLKVDGATDDLATLTTAATGFDPESEYRLAVRHLLQAWRQENYEENPPPAPSAENAAALTAGVPAPRVKKSENEFLLQFGLGYRFRRLGFVRTRIDMLSCLDDTSWRMARASSIALPQTPADEEAFVTELHRLKHVFAGIFDSLTKAQSGLANFATSPFGQAVATIGFKQADLDAILAHRSDADRQAAAAAALREKDGTNNFALAVDRASHEFFKLVSGAATSAEDALDADAPSLSPGARLARLAVGKYYDQFENFDFVTFPLRHSTEIGELDRVGVIRISPDDIANPPIALAGSSFGHFGGFLKREWREHDILLGRLHGAERLIAALLPPDDPERQALIDQAHQAILTSFVRRRDAENVTDLVVQGIAASATSPATASGAAAQQSVLRPDSLKQLTAIANANDANQYVSLLRLSLSPSALLRFYRESYAFDPSLPASDTARSLARATRVVGLMLKGLGRDLNRTTQPGAWIARLGGALWELVEIAAPDGIYGVLAQHWAAVIALCGGLVVAATMLIRVVYPPWYSAPLLAAGIVILVLPTLVMLAAWLLTDTLYKRARGSRSVFAAVKFVAAAAILILAGLGVWHLLE